MTNYSPDLTITMLLSASKLGTGIIMPTFCPTMPNFPPIMPTFCQLFFPLCYMPICSVPKTFLGQLLSTSYQLLRKFCSPPRASIFRLHKLTFIKTETCHFISHLYCYPIFACQSHPEFLFVYFEITAQRHCYKEWLQC